MKTKLSYAALATTASVAMLAGISGANAQTGPNGVQYCTTTQVNPGHNDCVMPAASAPGGGSFPGSFLVPGTNTSFAVHGYIQADIEHNFGPHTGDTSFSANGVALEGLGITNATAQTHALNGGTTMTVKATRPNIETRTPTGYGELKTYIEFDFNQTAGSELGGNNDLLRLRQAYGTLGPWLIGQTYSLFADLQAYADTAAGAQDVGMLNTFNVRRPMVRYTWLAGNGVSVAGAIEQPTYAGSAFSTGANTASALVGTALNGVTVYYNLPRAVAAAQLDQPWGHVKFAVAGGATDIRQANVTAGGTLSTPNHQIGDYAATLSGHLNTWGKDALRGGLTYNYGAADFTSWNTQGSAVFNNTSGAFSVERTLSAYASYEHFFTGQWRANAAAGYMHISGNPFNVTCGAGTACPQAGMVRAALTSELNVIYSPVPQTDFWLEWQHAYRKMMSGANGTLNQVDAEFRFYF
ncbi:MAG TPA: DcaP family trimeric outer membrane transporter [Stellaceae bacterium]|nr:DcaP family trimeric outer membrane transporter [Stellaceae bacterium]